MKQFTVRNTRGDMISIRPAGSATAAIELQRQSDISVAEARVEHARYMLKGAETELATIKQSPNEYSAGERA